MELIIIYLQSLKLMKSLAKLNKNVKIMKKKKNIIHLGGFGNDNPQSFSQHFSMNGEPTHIPHNSYGYNTNNFQQPGH